MGAQQVGDDGSAERTLLARQRTLLANERTFNAWVRTGLTTIAAGLAVVEVFGRQRYVMGVAGVLLVLLGFAVGAIALWRYRQVAASFDTAPMRPLPSWAATGLVLSLVGLGLLVLIAVLAG